MLDEILSCLLMMAFNYYNCDEYRILLMAICVFIEYYSITINPLSDLWSLKPQDDSEFETRG